MNTTCNVSSEEVMWIHTDIFGVFVEEVYPLIVETVLYTMHVTLTGYFLWSRFMERKTTPHVIHMSLVALAMFSLLSAFWAIDVYTLLDSATNLVNIIIFVDLGSPNPPDNFFVTYDRTWSLQFSQQCLISVMHLIGDYVVLWRAYVIWGRPRWLLVVVGILAITLPAVYGTLIWLGYFAGHGFQLLVRAVSLSPNLAATLLVSYKALLHWRSVRTFAQQEGTRHTLAILLVVIESGFVFVVLSATYVAAYFLEGLALAWSVFVLTPLFAMYPTLVLVLVATRRNLLERSIEAASTMSWRVPQPSEVYESDNHSSTRCSTCGRIGEGDLLRHRTSRRTKLEINTGPEAHYVTSHSEKHEDAQLRSTQTGSPASRSGSNPNGEEEEGNYMFIGRV